MSGFIPGLHLSERFYREAVAPLLAEEFPGLEYSAGLIGSGSEVLGYDTAMSTDHDWGPRVMLFLKDDDHHSYAQGIDEVLRQGLPTQFREYSTNFTPPDPLDNNVQRLADIESGPINHRVEY